MGSPRFATSVALILVFAAFRAHAQEPFHVLLDPPFYCVPVGTTITVDLAVDSTAHQFNGYEVTIHHDPAILSWNPPVAEGSLMTGACPNRFKSTTSTDSTVTYAHVILCNGVSLNGPGPLSRYTYHADHPGITELTIVSDPDRSFYDAGLYIWPGHPTFPRQVIFSNCTIVVLDPTSGAEGAAQDPFAAVRVVPSPSSRPMNVVFENLAPGPCALDLFDPSGRRLARWERPFVPAGVLHLAWSDLDLADHRLPAGTYFLRLMTPHGGGNGRCVILP